MAPRTLRTTKTRAEFDSTNRLRKLFGDSGVEIERQFAGSVPQKTTARKMLATFANGGDWDTIDLDEKVHFTQADRTADARHATMLKSSNAITLTGAPTVADAQTRTTAAKIEIQQDTGAISRDRRRPHHVSLPQLHRHKSIRKSQHRPRPGPHFLRHSHRLRQRRPPHLHRPRPHVARRLGSQSPKSSNSGASNKKSKPAKM